jgi:hypothetical protein
VLGAPGPENSFSPVERNSQFGFSLLDQTAGQSNPPNRERTFGSDPANNSTFGTMTIRRRVTNNTGHPVTRLRFRVVVVTGFPVADAANAELRVRSSPGTTVNNIQDSATCQASGFANAPCNVNVQGLSLEAPPSQLAGGGLNSSLSLDSVTTTPMGKRVRTGTVKLRGPLADGTSVNVQFLLGVQKTGKFRFLINIEALP